MSAADLAEQEDQQQMRIPRQQGQPGDDYPTAKELDLAYEDFFYQAEHDDIRVVFRSGALSKLHEMAEAAQPTHTGLPTIEDWEDCVVIEVGPEGFDFPETNTEVSDLWKMGRVPRGGPPLFNVQLDLEDCVTEHGFDGGGYCEVNFTISKSHRLRRRAWQRLYMEAAGGVEACNPRDVDSFLSAAVRQQMLHLDDDSADPRLHLAHYMAEYESDDGSSDDEDPDDTESVEIMERIMGPSEEGHELFDGWSVKITDCDGNMGARMLELSFSRKRKERSVVKAAMKRA